MRILCCARAGMFHTGSLFQAITGSRRYRGWYLLQLHAISEVCQRINVKSTATGSSGSIHFTLRFKELVSLKTIKYQLLIHVLVLIPGCYSHGHLHLCVWSQGNSFLATLGPHPLMVDVVFLASFMRDSCMG